MNMKVAKVSFAVFVISWIMVAPARADTITLTNANFADFDGGTGAATGWTFVDGAGTNSSPSNWVGTVSGIQPNVAHIKSDGGNYIQQTITTSALGGLVDAGTFSDYTVNFDYGYRRDGATNGDLTLRFSLWNTTDNTELAGQDLTIPDPGVGSSSISAGSVHLAYDTTGLAGNEIAFRVTSTSGDLEGSAWERTAIVTNFSITAIPEPTALILLITGLLAYAWRKRK